MPSNFFYNIKFSMEVTNTKNRKKKSTFCMCFSDITCVWQRTTSERVIDRLRLAQSAADIATAVVVQYGNVDMFPIPYWLVYWATGTGIYKA